MAKKRVLIITYYWPPSGGSGVQRWAYFAKHLEKEGEWEPLVLTVDPDYASYPVIDSSLEELTRDVRVFKTKSFDLLKVYSRLKGGGKSQKIPQGSVGSKNKKSLIDKLALRIRSNYFIPDARVGWNKHAYKEAVEIITKNNVDLIISTGPPHSTHLIADKLKENFKIKWIADFRDPWREVFYSDLFSKYRSEKKDALDAELEIKILNSADYVTTVGESMKELLSGKIANDKNKTHVFHNGYDADLIDSVKEVRNNKFTIVHIGVISEKQPYKALYEFLKELSSTVKEDIRLEIAGNVNDTILDLFKKLDTIEFIYHGKVSHKQAISVMKSGDLLVNCLADTPLSKLLISGKLMEYIACSKPILVIGDKEGDAAKLLNSFETGITLHKEETEQMCSFARNLIENPTSSEANVSQIKEFSRLSISKKLSKFMSSIID